MTYSRRACMTCGTDRVTAHCDACGRCTDDQADAVHVRISRKDKLDTAELDYCWPCAVKALPSYAVVGP